MTKTPLLLSIPSISVSNWLTTLALGSLELPPSLPPLRLGQRASSSSKKITQGEELRARWNTCRTARSLSPTYCEHENQSYFMKRRQQWSYAYHVEKFWPLDRDEVDACLVGHSFCQQGLSAARRPTQEYSRGGLHAKGLCDLGVVDRAEDAELQLLPEVAQGTYVVPCHVRDSGEPFTFGRRLKEI